MKLFTDASYGIRVQRSVEVHRHLHRENDGQNRPLLPIGEAEAKLFVAVFFGDFIPVVGSVFFVELAVLLGGWLISSRIFVVRPCVQTVVFSFGFGSSARPIIRLLDGHLGLVVRHGEVGLDPGRLSQIRGKSVVVDMQRLTRAARRQI